MGFLFPLGDFDDEMVVVTMAWLRRREGGLSCIVLVVEIYFCSATLLVPFRGCSHYVDIQSKL